MRKYISLLIFCLLGQFAFAQAPSIQWDANQKLTWADFSGPVTRGSHHHALTASGVSIDMKQVSDDSVGITILANFFPKESWLKEGKDSDHLLNHEQRHFDISEIFRRKLVKKLMTSNALRSSDISKIVDKLYTANDAALLKYQERYDEQTMHSQKTAQQEIWNKKIDDDLADLSEYTTSRIMIPISALVKRKSTSRKKSSKRKRRG